MPVRKFSMPNTPVIGKAGDRDVVLNEPFQGYLGGVEKVSKRVAAYVNPTTATASQIATALINAGLMEPE